MGGDFSEIAAFCHRGGHPYNRRVVTAQTLSDLAGLTPRELRLLFRAGEYGGPTAGLAPGFVQANLVMLPSSLAVDFLAFCERNPEPCPLIEVTAAGNFEPRCAPGADLRCDLPRYRVYRNGELVDRPECIRFDCVGPPTIQKEATSFLLGCSFTFENALQRAGIPVRHIEQKCNVPMYRTSIACRPSGHFSGPMVVSMRPMTHSQAEQAKDITMRLPGSHGGPVHIGDPSTIGITDIGTPDYGDPVEIRNGEVPVFWACGVTPLEAILRAKPEWAMVHEPGHMFITDSRT